MNQTGDIDVNLPTHLQAHQFQLNATGTVRILFLTAFQFSSIFRVRRAVFPSRLYPDRKSNFPSSGS